MDLDDDSVESDQLSQGRQTPKKSRRRQRNSVNPFLLPTYGSFNEEQAEKKEQEPPRKPKADKPHLNFKRLAKAITQQRKLNSLLQVTTIEFGGHRMKSVV